MSKQRRLRAAAEREKRWRLNTMQAMGDMFARSAREDLADERAEQCERARGLTLDEWYRLACIVDFAALADARWDCDGNNFDGVFVDLDWDLAEELGVDIQDVFVPGNLAMVYARDLLKALEVTT